MLKGQGWVCIGDESPRTAATRSVDARTPTGLNSRLKLTPRTAAPKSPQILASYPLRCLAQRVRLSASTSDL